jgi:hypothetical protein
MRHIRANVDPAPVLLVLEIRDGDILTLHYNRNREPVTDTIPIELLDGERFVECDIQGDIKGYADISGFAPLVLCDVEGSGTVCSYPADHKGYHSFETLGSRPD